MNIKVIGAGGIGTALIYPLARYLNYSTEEGIRLTVIDGDAYENKNMERQTFDTFGNKAEVTVNKLKEEFSNISFKACAEYVKPSSIDYLVCENDIVFLCVDNHKTRKLVSDACCSLKNVVLISGGNKLTDGNMQIHVRQKAKDITLPIASEFHPEIIEPKDKRPDEISCEEQTESEPQLIFMNGTIAFLMLNAYYAYKQGKLKYDEVYADILTNNVRAAQRSQFT